MRVINRGFTLVELLVAITVLAFVAMMGWRGLDAIVRSRQALTEQMESSRGVQLAFAQLQNDLEQLADKTLLADRRQLVADNATLVLVRAVLAENEPTRLQVVAYRIRDGVLLRKESVATRDLIQIDALWQAALSDTGPAPDVALQTGVTQMTARVWDGGGWQAAPAPQVASAGVINSANPGAGAALAAQAQAQQQQTGFLGLEWSLQLARQQGPLVKSFLVGAQ